jgi:hypothetical protein
MAAETSTATNEEQPVMTQLADAVFAFPATGSHAPGVSADTFDGEPDVIGFPGLPVEEPESAVDEAEEPESAVEAVPVDKVKPLTRDTSLFYDDLSALAAKYVKRFFNNKTAYYGGPIDRRIIVKPHFISQVLNTSVEAAVQSVYDHWHVSKMVSLREIRRAIKNGNIPSDIESVVAVLAECAALGVPKCFAGGIMLMYFEFCEGWDFTESPLSMAS